MSKLSRCSSSANKIPDQVCELEIIAIIVHQHVSDITQYLIARHCYAQIVFKNGTRGIIERGGNNFGVTLDKWEKPRSNIICEAECIPRVTLKSIQEDCIRFIVTKDYDLLYNNCYHFIIFFMELLKLNTESIELVRKADQNNSCTDGMNTIVKTVSTGVKLVTCSADDVARAGVIMATVSQKAGQQVLVQAFKSVSKLGFVAIAAGQTVCQVIQMHKKNYQPERVAKGIGNIVVGTGGAVGGACGGAYAGAAIGVIGGPIGIIAGGLIGGVAGSLAGSVVLKKLAPWNWF